MPEETPLAPSEGFSDLRSEVVERGTAPVKKKIGRPSNAERVARGETVKKKTDEPKPDFIPIETMVEIVALPFDIYAARKGEHWKLTEPEKKQIGALTAKVLNKHVPGWLEQYGDEIALATVLGMALVTRIMVDIANARQAEKPIIPQMDSIPSFVRSDN
jgi:hypothetical protein